MVALKAIHKGKGKQSVVDEFPIADEYHIIKTAKYAHTQPWELMGVPLNDTTRAWWFAWLNIVQSADSQFDAWRNEEDRKKAERNKK